MRVREKYSYILQVTGLFFTERILPPVDNVIWHFGGWEEMAGWLPRVLLEAISAFFSTVWKKEKDGWKTVDEAEMSFHAWELERHQVWEAPEPPTPF